MIKYKINVLRELKSAGYSTYTLRKRKLLSESTIQKIREDKLPSMNDLDRICGLLNAQPGDILVYEK